MKSANDRTACLHRGSARGRAGTEAFEAEVEQKEQNLVRERHLRGRKGSNTEERGGFGYNMCLSLIKLYLFSSKSYFCLMSDPAATHMRNSTA